ncbi:MAG: glutamate-1-semialdehyde 2,1-aminomutase [Planctomycetota bacterium]
MRDPATSQELFARARDAMPGGVSSPVRAFGAVGGSPLFVQRAEGARIYDVDGNDFLDYVMSWGPLILGHAHAATVAAIAEQASRGTSFGAPHLAELELAETVRGVYPGVERVRFTSSGTEAVQSAVRLARAATGRSHIVKFEGCYHGHGDGMLVAAGSGAITLGQPSSAGVPADIAGLTLVLGLDDVTPLRALMRGRGGEVAAIVVEPMPANNGLLLQRPEFLQAIRELATDHGALVLFDEVISGFRVARGGAAELYGVEPDLVTFGKILGGGVPCGAFAGRSELMEQLAPNGPTYHAGTLSGNPLAMVAGLETIRALADGRVYGELEELGARMEEGVARIVRDGGFPVRLVREGSVFWLSFSADQPPRRADQIPEGAAEPYAKFFRGCLSRGVCLAPSAFEVGFLSAAHRPADIDETVDVFAAALRDAFA